MHKAIRLYSVHNLQIFYPGLFICAILYVSQVQVGICLGSLEFYHDYRCQQVIFVTLIPIHVTLVSWVPQTLWEYCTILPS
jgi:hypothetical protein